LPRRPPTPPRRCPQHPPLAKKALMGENRAESHCCGEQWDPNAGWYYLRARWMSPEQGLFVGVDPYAGDLLAPVSLHRYLYADASPVSNADPTGEMTLVDVAVTGAIIGIVSTIYTAVAWIGTERWGTIEWHGYMAGVTGGGLTVGGFLIGLTSEEVNGHDATGIYLVAAGGWDVGPLPVSVTGAPVTVETPALYGPNGWLLAGPFGIAGASYVQGVGITATGFTMGIGVGWFSPGVAIGRDIGLLGMGGFAIPLVVQNR
jgi:RHS repeat-associated protein